MEPTPKAPTVIPPILASFQIGGRCLNRRFLERVIDNTFRAASHGHGFVTDLLNSWIEAGCRWDRWEKNDRFRAWKLVHGPGKGLDEWRVWIRAGRDGRAVPYAVGRAAFEPDAPKRANSDEALAHDIFALFLVAAAPRAEVGICERCRGFYWNRWGHANKRFCSRKCSQLQTAKEGQAQKLRDERKEKNTRIEKAIKDFFENLIWDKPDPPDWKRWVASRARVTVSYLTRAFNRGLRGEPDGLKLTKAQIQNLESKGRSRHANL